MQDRFPDTTADPEDLTASLATVPATLVAAAASGARRYDTPILPVQPYPANSSRATLTLLTGIHAGLLVLVSATGMTVGRAADADLVVEDPGVSRRHARVAHTPDGGFCVEDLGSTNGTFVGSRRIDVSPLRGGDVVQLGPQLLLRFALVDVAEVSLYRRLYDASVHDPLTHLFNRKYLAEQLVAELARARRGGSELALLMTDIDCLKEVNDRFGHLAGDRALCIVGAQVKRAIRGGDLLARYGGDEFTIVSPQTGGVEAVRLAERVRRAVEGLRIGARGQTVRMTLSIGVASLTEVARSAAEPIVALLALADARLYCAKASGRNRVCTAVPQP